MNLTDYSNDCDLLFNSKEVFISAKTQFVTHTDILYFEKYRKVSELPSLSQSSTRPDILSLSRGQTVFGSLEPSPRALLFPLGAWWDTIHFTFTRKIRGFWRL